MPMTGIELFNGAALVCKFVMLAIPATSSLAVQSSAVVMLSPIVTDWPATACVTVMQRRLLHVRGSPAGAPSRAHNARDRATRQQLVSMRRRSFTDVTQSNTDHTSHFH